MIKNSESEFLLCYDAFACYVDRVGEPIRLDNIIEWEGLPRSVAFHSPFILAFDSKFVEVRDSSSGQLVQLIKTNDLRNISGSSTTISSMEDEDAILLVQKIRSNQGVKAGGSRVAPFDYQQVFQLVSTHSYPSQPIHESGSIAPSKEPTNEWPGSSSTATTGTPTTTDSSHGSRPNYYRSASSGMSPSGVGWI
jgi:hypothetical protein